MPDLVSFKDIIAEKKGKVGIITLNRPTVMNALSDNLMSELSLALADFEQDDDIGSIVITGSEKVFAAGADIKEMVNQRFSDAYMGNFISRNWEAVTTCRKPVIAAVAGYALGGGCELAMMCDFILAGENAKFGQPEITIGTLPGAGGSQRLTRFVGKSKAMEMCLTGRMMDAAEAERCGLVSRVVPESDLFDEAVRTAKRIADMSRPMVYMVKQAVNAAYETTLSQGISLERHLFHSSFSTLDQKEGMNAFVEKRQPDFKGE